MDWGHRLPENNEIPAPGAAIGLKERRHEEGDNAANELEGTSSKITGSSTHVKDAKNSDPGQKDHAEITFIYVERDKSGDNIDRVSGGCQRQESGSASSVSRSTEPWLRQAKDSDIVTPEKSGKLYPVYITKVGINKEVPKVGFGDGDDDQENIVVDQIETLVQSAFVEVDDTSDLSLGSGQPVQHLLSSVPKSITQNSSTVICSQPVSVGGPLAKKLSVGGISVGSTVGMIDKEFSYLHHLDGASGGSEHSYWEIRQLSPVGRYSSDGADQFEQIMEGQEEMDFREASNGVDPLTDKTEINAAGDVSVLKKTTDVVTIARGDATKFDDRCQPQLLSSDETAMDRVSSWVVKQDTDSLRENRPVRDSPRPFDRHSIAEMPLKQVGTVVPIEIDVQDDVFQDNYPQGVTTTHAFADTGSQLLDDNGRRGDRENRDRKSAAADLGAFSSRGRGSKEDQGQIEMKDVGCKQSSEPHSGPEHRTEGGTITTSFLEGWMPASPYAHRVKRNHSGPSDAAQQNVQGKTKIRQLSLDIGEEWEHMLGMAPATSTDIPPKQNHRRIRSQQLSWSGSSGSSGKVGLSRHFRYLSHQGRLENYLRKKTIPEDKESPLTPPLPTTDIPDLENIQVDSELPQAEASTSEEKRWLLLNPYNKINQRFHSTLHCPCFLFFCFLCCAPAVYYMQMSDKEFDYGSKDKARIYGRRATILYLVGALCSVAFLGVITSVVVIYLQEYLTRSDTLHD